MRYWPDELRDNTQSWLHIIDGTLTAEHNAWLRLRRILCNAFLDQLADPDVNIPQAMFESLAVAIAAILTDNFHYENVELTKIVQSVKEFMNNTLSKKAEDFELFVFRRFFIVQSCCCYYAYFYPKEER